MFQKTDKQKQAISLLQSLAMHIMVYGGSGSGKTLLFLYALFVRASKAAKSRHVIFRKHFNSVKTSIWMQTYPRLKSMCFDEMSIQENKSDYFWTLPNGSEVWIAGLDEKERTEKVLGKEYSTIFFNECSEIAYDSVLTALTRLRETSGLSLKAYYDENPPLKKHWSHKVFIEKLDPISNTSLSNPALYAYLQINPRDNISNLPTNYITDILERLPERKRKRFLEGEFQDDIQGALWNSNLINAYRIRRADLPPLSRIVVGVDPAVTSGAMSDETGIITAGKSEAGHYYILDDRSLVASPLEWGRAVIAAYKIWQADRVIGETNNGGDLIEGNLRNIDGTISYKGIHASRGKIVRAEPIAALYERGLVHHVGEFPELEGEMCSYTGDKNEASPNRLDAGVWGLTELSGVSSLDPHVFSSGEDRHPAEVNLDNEIERLKNEILKNSDISDADKLEMIKEYESI